ncbi:uncharacterized protein LOC126298253 [Schistocerca gregaria]|uniref:uncharacterized protein LOC126298253 n=1 Tax=Schistocerca gregaria TaxID=7010 RepID=UPI00211E7BAB|nr:uncharacterized protein LOC126298253 [Schistocerca gregaria]
MWRVIKKENCSSVPENENVSLSPEGTKVIDPKLAMTKFNEYFTSLTEDIIQLNCKGSVKSFSSKSVILEASMYVYQTNPDEIINKIKSLSNKMSSALDEVPDFILKACAHHIVKLLAKIFDLFLSRNWCLSRYSQNSKSFTISKKKGSSDGISNYQIVSQLSSFSKILQKPFYNRKPKSTQTVISEFLDCVVKSLDQHKLAAGIFLDLSKAFNTWTRAVCLKNYKYVE